MLGVIRDPVTTGGLTVSGENKETIQEWGKALQKEMRKK